jgi:DNA-directed RNA polymerase II subunit RPB2
LKLDRLLLTVLERRPMDDRDHFGNKRLDLAGPLLGNLFRQLFKKLTKDIKISAQKAIDSRKEVELRVIVKQETVSRRLKVQPNRTEPSNSN